jgi:hypothetical protein
MIAGRARDLDDVRSSLLKQAEIDIDLVRITLGESEIALEQSLVEPFDRIRRTLNQSV